MNPARDFGDEDGYVEPRTRKPGILAIAIGFFLVAGFSGMATNAVVDRIASIGREDPDDRLHQIWRAERVCRAAATHALLWADTRANAAVSDDERVALLDASVAAMSGRDDAIARYEELLDRHPTVDSWSGAVASEYEDALRGAEKPGDPAQIARDPRCTDLRRYLDPEGN